MNKNLILIFIIILVVAGTIAVIQQQQSSNQIEQMEMRAINKLKAMELEKAKQKALVEEAKRIEIEQAAQKVIEEAKKLEATTQRKARALQAKISGLVAQAQSLLDSGKFQQAIDLAKSALSQDPNNTSAKSILNQAMTQLKKATQQKAEALAEEKAANALKNIGIPGQ